MWRGQALPYASLHTVSTAAVFLRLLRSCSGENEQALHHAYMRMTRRTKNKSSSSSCCSGDDQCCCTFETAHNFFIFCVFVFCDLVAETNRSCIITE